jgi:hypothetical protein
MDCKMGSKKSGMSKKAHKAHEMKEGKKSMSKTKPGKMMYGKKK